MARDNKHQLEDTLAWLCEELAGCSPEQQLEAAIKKTVELARAVGGEDFASVEGNKVMELEASHKQQLMDEDLKEVKSASEEEEAAEEEMAHSAEDHWTLFMIIMFKVYRYWKSAVWIFGVPCGGALIICGFCQSAGVSAS